MKVFQMFLPLMWEGLAITFKVFALTLLFSLPLSLIVVKARMSKYKVIRLISAGYIYIMRGTPLLLQLMFVFFGLPLLPGGGIALGRLSSVYIAFILNYTAYFAEIFRGGIQSIPEGQTEAAEVLGLSPWITFRRVILPQVIKTVLPSLSNEIITLVKDTSLVYVLGVMDILKAARSVSNTYATFTPYLYVAIVYLLIIAVLTKILDGLEKKYVY